MADDTEQPIDGDKVIAFINAVQSMGRILEQVNVIEIREAFLIGKKVKCIDDIVAMDKKWKSTVKEIVEDIAQETLAIQESMRHSREQIALLKHYQSVCASPEQKHTTATMKEFLDLCDRLQKHKEAGTFELVQQILK